MEFLFAAAASTALLTGSPAAIENARPTIVLVHGAFADSSSWNGVIRILEKDGYDVVAVANPLRSLKSDAQYVANVVNAIKAPVVLVGHSYGGAVISEAASNASSVKALVYVAAFAPDVGESAFTLSGKFPGSTLGEALAPPVAIGDGRNDLYIQPAKFHQQFAADVSAKNAALMSAGQRPVTDAALNETAIAPAWKSLPSWFIYGDADKNIPAAVLAFMAERANAKQTEFSRGHDFEPEGGREADRTRRYFRAMSTEFDPLRRKLMGGATATIAIAQLARSGSADAQAREPATRDSQQSMPIRQIDAGDLSVGYTDFGPHDGKVAMLLHGWPYDIHSFVDVAPALAERGFRIIAPLCARLRHDTLSHGSHTSQCTAGSAR